MSFFGKILGRDSEKHVFWNHMESEADLNKAIEASNQAKVVIFKHSTRCHISKSVLRNFENEINSSEKQAKYYFLDLLAHRNLSNKIAEDLDVQHQSPQIIILENGKAVKNASHDAISLSLV